MPPPKSHTNNNVYILGAGFSRDAGFPLVADFLDRTRDSVAWLEAAGRDEEADAVARVLQFRLDAASAAYRVQLNVEDIEQLFSLASGREGVDEKLTEQMKLSIAATLDYAYHNRISKIANVGVKKGTTPDSASWRLLEDHEDEIVFAAPCYEFYAGMMAGGFSEDPGQNTIITLNYDTLVEEALQNLGYAVSYGFGSRQADQDQSWRDRQGSARWTVPLLKLHGSVNWAYPGGRGQRLTAFGSYADLRQRALVPTLIPPTWRKEFGDPLSDVWAEAVKALETATRVFVIGFSIPETDPHFKYLLAAGLQNNISLRRLYFINIALQQADTAKEFTRRIFSILRPELHENVVQLKSNSTDDFFLSEAGAAWMGRRMDGHYHLRSRQLV